MAPHLCGANPRPAPPGPIRVGIIFIASAFGANFLSITYEDPCVLYVGASGAVFGFVGLAISGGRRAPNA